MSDVSQESAQPLPRYGGALCATSQLPDHSWAWTAMRLRSRNWRWGMALQGVVGRVVVTRRAEGGFNAIELVWQS